MPRRRRDTNVFSLSFLDCMSCGFGAVVLFFMIINHATEVRSDDANRELLAEVDLIEKRVLDGEQYLVELRNSLEEIDKETAVTEGLSRQVIDQLVQSREQLASANATTVAREEHINRLKSDLKTLEDEVKRLREDRSSMEADGGAARQFIGQGDRQYLTGLKVGGKRILILVDASSSMLDDTIVNIIRRRNMSDTEKLAARKWQRVVSAVDWLTTQVPVDSEFQLYVFNTRVSPAIPDTLGTWQEADSGRRLDEAVNGLRKVIPSGGTSLVNAIEAAAALRPLPDNLYLLTDSLPTQGRNPPRGSTVNGKARARLFEEAVGSLPPGVPVNVILLPMEGDPMAAGAFWQLAQVTGGSFISPSADWP